MDATEKCVDVLRAAGLDADVSSQIPAARPERYIMVSRAGGSSDGFIDRPTMELLVWGTSDEDASSLCMSAVYALTDAAQTDPLISYAALDSMSRDEWTATGASRYRALVQMAINK